MDYIESLNFLHLLILTIPGFFLVWSYNKAKHRKIESDFEYFIFSFFFGLLIIIIFGTFMSKEKFTRSFFENPYAGAVSLSIFTVLTGRLFGGGFDKYFDWAIDRMTKKKGS